MGIVHPVAIILASRSPRRKMLLEEAGFMVTVVPPCVEEVHQAGETPGAYVVRNASLKADAALSRVARTIGDQEVILGADTVVTFGREILEKPRDADDAIRMLGCLSGITHSVWTGVCLISGATKTSTTFAESSDVVFRTLDPEMIGRYVATGEPMDKAGAYAIQGHAACFIDHIDGSYSNVVGLPMERVLERLSMGNR